jgi:hypothetical protein
LRLTKEVDPSSVRPIRILLQAMDLVKSKWSAEKNYVKASDQLKSIRQDLKVQGIETEDTVKAYELHARIALEAADLNEFNQCQTQLRELYSNGLGFENMIEFIAYRILYFTVTKSNTEMLEAMSKLTSIQKNTSEVAHALKVRHAAKLCNISQFLDLYETAPNMGRHLMTTLLDNMRIQALKRIFSSSGRTVIKVNWLRTMLYFQNNEEILNYFKNLNIVLKENNAVVDCEKSKVSMGEKLTPSLL